MSKRHERLTQLFLQEINLALRNTPNLNDRGLLTITTAKLSGDEKELKVYYSVINATPEQTEAKARLLTAKAREIRTVLYKRLRLKSIPEIHFEFDDTPEKAARIEELLAKVREERENDEKENGNTAD
ncbi:MAG: 30S ribosome-binding factor RbfA [Elusimicrobiales bacterium]|jgi:ribosome-binding factor A|nr:30S ribosome-binding factor RbfA [Elusimicrobiales bacterium]